MNTHPEAKEGSSYNQGGSSRSRERFILELLRLILEPWRLISGVLGCSRGGMETHSDFIEAHPRVLHRSHSGAMEAQSSKVIMGSHTGTIFAHPGALDTFTLTGCWKDTQHQKLYLQR
jgi:hypothetical protein